MSPPGRVEPIVGKGATAVEEDSAAAADSAAAEESAAENGGVALEVDVTAES
jgi:hypothetical protein